MSLMPHFMQVAAQKPALCPANITLVASGKGGVGKTWLAITLCQILAQQGRKVLLVDGDLGMANVDVQLGITPARHLGHFASGQARLKDLVCPSTPQGFDVIAGGRGAASATQLSPAQLVLLQEEVKILAPIYDHVFIDLGAGMSQSTQILTRAAQQCLMVVVDEPTSLTDAYGFMKFNARQRPQLNFQIVINQADNAAAGQHTYATIAQVCQRFLGTRPALAGIIRRDPCVRDAIRAQNALMARAPHSRASQDVTAVAHHLRCNVP